MYYLKFSIVLYFIFIITVVNCALVPPKINGSFFATGEMVSGADISIDGQEVDTDAKSVVAFEETYDKELDISGVEFQVGGMTMRVFEDITLRKTYRMIYDNPTSPGMCTEVTNDEWIKMGIEPQLKQFEVQKGVAIMPLRQLFTLASKGLSDQPKPVTYRNIPAQLWSYKTDGVIIDAYWSVGEWKTSSAYNAIPLGFKITRQEAGKTKISYINIMEIQQERVDEKLIKPIRGLYCEGKSSDVYPFPTSINELQELSFSTEVVFNEQEIVTSVDTWIDFPSKLMKTSFDPFGRESYSSYHTFNQIVSMNQGVMYEISEQKRQSCLVSDLLTKEVQDMQLIFDYRNENKWNGRAFFGIDVVNYTYAGEISDMGIPCRLYHGMRNDFPYGAVGFQTLWEWCIEKDLTDRSKNGFPAISLTIYFKAINKSVELSPRITEGDSFMYHFYNVRPRMVPISVHKPVFDIGNCFSASKRTKVAIAIPVNDKYRDILESAVNDVFYVYKWFEITRQCSKTDLSSLRFSDFHLQFGNTGELGLFFTILERHEDLPEKLYQKEQDTIQIYNNIELCIKEEKLSVTTKIKDEAMTLIASKIVNLKKDSEKFLYSPAHIKPNAEFFKLESLPKPVAVSSKIQAPLWTLLIVAVTRYLV